jgi:hypothetical protein
MSPGAPELFFSGINLWLSNDIFSRNISLSILRERVFTCLFEAMISQIYDNLPFYYAIIAM